MKTRSATLPFLVSAACMTMGITHDVDPASPSPRPYASWATAAEVYSGFVELVDGVDAGVAPAQ